MASTEGRDRNGVEPPAVVWFTGPPAAGKSTFRATAESWATAQGLDFRSVGIEDIHRQQCPPNRKSKDYYYDGAGALVLLRPDVQIPAAERALLDLVSGRPRLTFAEAGFGSLSSVVQEHPAAFSNATILYFSAPLGTRLTRNDGRGELRIPPSAVARYPETYTDEDERVLAAVDAEIHVLLTSQPIEEVRLRLVDVLEQSLTLTA